MSLRFARDDRDHHHLEQESHAPGEEGRQEAADQRPDGGGDRRAAPTSA
jgi:hypothetical protein